jgi:hypothetical protein
VAPLSGSLELDQKVVQAFSHGNDSVGHLLDLSEPLLKERLVAQDGLDQLSPAMTLVVTLDELSPVQADALDGRAGPKRSDDPLDLRQDPLLLLGRGDDHREGSRSFTVQPQVLGEGLAQQDLVTLLDKVSERKGISGDVARGESLVGLLVSMSLTPGRRRQPTMSKRTRCFFDLMVSDSSRQLSWVGSIPVGLCAQAWRRICM